MNKQSWSVGIFCYNERGTLKKLIEKVLELIPVRCSEFELILVDDGSTDGSGQIVKETAQKYSDVIVPVFFETNQGIGAALNIIYKKSRFENVVAIPGDGQFDIGELIPYLSFSENHFLSFYRKENLIYGKFRNELSLINRKINQHILGITVKDVNWVHAYKKEDLGKLNLQLKSSLIQSEICAKLLYLGLRKIEIESKYLPRVYGQSKGGSLKIVLKALKDLFILSRVVRRFKKNECENAYSFKIYSL